MTKVIKKRLNSLWYLLGVINVLPMIGVIGGVWSLGVVSYFYWIECAFVAAIALAVYARYLAVLIILLIAIAFIIYLANPALFVDTEPLIIFWCLYTLCWLSYIEVGRSSYGQKVKKLKHEEQLIIYLLVMGLSIAVCMPLASILSGGQGLWGYDFRFYAVFTNVAILVPTISIGLLKVIDMIGQRHFLEFLLGTYHNPVERERIVLFLDMVGSSTMAEKLDPKKSMQLIGRFIYDCGFIFRVNRGDILNYTGDGLVVLWHTNQANSALMAVQQLRAHFELKRTRQEYWKAFGAVPDFRIGIHAGKIVLNQIGEEKLFIGLYGDVVNTAARLEQMNKELGTNILISKEVVKGLNQSWKTLLKPLGEKEVRGRDEKVSVFTIYQQR